MPLKTLLLVVFFATLSSCATSKKVEPELSAYKGRKVALIEVEGESTSRKVVEVALINQLVKRGSFVLVNKKDVEAARVDVKVDARNDAQVATHAGAEIALRAKVIEFDGEVHEGHSTERVYDEQLAAERGEKEGTTDRLYKVKRLDGKVKVELTFIDLKNSDTRVGIAEAVESTEGDERKGAIHLPPVLRFLEKVANTAFQNFFEKYE